MLCHTACAFRVRVGGGWRYEAMSSCEVLLGLRGVWLNKAISIGQALFN
jgi:hypothetical protein